MSEIFGNFEFLFLSCDRDCYRDNLSPQAQVLLWNLSKI